MKDDEYSYEFGDRLCNACDICPDRNECPDRLPESQADDQRDAADVEADSIPDSCSDCHACVGCPNYQHEIEKNKARIATLMDRIEADEQKAAAQYFELPDRQSSRSTH